MSIPDDIPGLGRRTDRPHFNALAKIAELPLSAVEGFVLSRVDGLTSYQDICLLTNLGAEATLEILRKLKSQRIILGPGEPHVPVAFPAATSPRPPSPTPASPPVAVSISVLERLDDGTPVDEAALLAGKDLDPLTKARIIRVHRRLKKLTGRELLGLPDTADRGTAKKAYFAASKELHPDRFFGKDLGPFRPLLNEIFVQLARALEEIR